MEYVSARGTLQFSGGANFDLGPLTITVKSFAASTTSASPSFIGFYEARTEIYPKFFFTEFTHGASSPLSTDLTERLALNGLAGAFDFEIYFTEEQLTSPVGCFLCFIYVRPVSTEITSNGQPFAPQITPVPVPAPFLMLGMAMLGLIGFGRRAKG